MAGLRGLRSAASQSCTPSRRKRFPMAAAGNELPPALRAHVERLSGMDLSDVKVHYHSSQPAQLQAHAYAQGAHIHLGPGQESHLAHEVWHVVQQQQGRVGDSRRTHYGLAADDHARAVELEMAARRRPGSGARRGPESALAGGGLALRQSRPPRGIS